MFPTIELCLSDTDSSYFFYTGDDDLYYKIKQNQSIFDCSPYNPDDPMFSHLHSKENASVNGKLKDDYCNTVIAEIVSLRSKLYAVKFYRRLLNTATGCYEFEREASTSCRAKGIPRQKAISLPFDTFVQSLSNHQQTNVTYKCIKSDKLQIFTHSCTKQAVNSLCCKRWQVNSTQTLPFGHKDVEMELK